MPARWLLGYRPHIFQKIFGDTYPAGSLYVGTDVVVNHPHNLMLDRLMAAGLFGLITYLALIVSLIASLIDTWW